MKLILLIFVFFAMFIESGMAMSHKSIIPLSSRGVVVVLETPLFKKPNTDSRILQYVRNGTTLFINGIDPDPLFYKTVDNLGRDAFILKDHVEIIESDSGMIGYRSTMKHDPTNYRLKGVIPPGYPFYDQNMYRFTMGYATGPGRHISYPYLSPIISEDIGFRKGITSTYTRNIKEDTSVRIFFGGNFKYYFSNSRYLLEDDTKTREEAHELVLGPYASYDAFRSHNHLLTLGASVNLVYHRVYVRQGAIEGEANKRRYHAFSVSPGVSASFLKSTGIPNLAFLLGMDMHFDYDHHLRSSYEDVPEGWNRSNDKISVPAGGIFAVFLGFQTHMGLTGFAYPEKNR